MELIIAKHIEGYFHCMDKDDKALFLSIDMENKDSLRQWVDAYIYDSVTERWIVDAILKVINWDLLYEWVDNNLYL